MSIVVRKKTSKGSNIAVVVIFLLAALIGFTMAGSYSDLRIWAFWCLVCAVLALISAIKAPKKGDKHDAE